MWKKEDVKSQGVPEISTGPGPAPAGNSGNAVRNNAANPPLSPRPAACISQGIKIKGEVTGSEDLFIDGQVDGRLDCGNASITVGPNGSVKADITAREVIVRGNVDGKISGREKVQLWSTGRVTGEVQTERLAIEEGAVLHGKVEAGKLQSKTSEARKASVANETKPAAATTVASGGTTTGAAAN